MRKIEVRYKGGTIAAFPLFIWKHEDGEGTHLFLSLGGVELHSNGIQPQYTQRFSARREAGQVILSAFARGRVFLLILQKRQPRISIEIHTSGHSHAE